MKLITIPKKYIASFLALVMVFGVFVFVAPVEAQAVEINANATGFGGGLYYSDESGVTSFANGAAIKVVNLMRTSKNEATYTTTDGTNWTTSDAFVWNSSSKNTFQAWYPVAEYSSYDAFTIPTDQGDATKLASADWMTASTGEIDKPENGVLDLSFQHRLAKVTVTVSEFTSQYAEGATLSGATIYSLTADNVSVENADNGVTPYQEGNSVTAIVCPGKYNADATLMEINVKDENGNYTLAVPVNDYLVNTGLAAGSHYTFSLKVGKDVVAISSVTVEGWVEMEIDGGVAEEEVYPNIINATAMDASALNEAVVNALELKYTDLTVTLKPDAPAEMITAIRRAICDTEGVADGSIHLTLKGVTTIPGTTNWDGVAFGPRDAQWDENNVEIVSHEEVTQLASVNLPDVTEIGAQAFYFCENLVSVSAPKAQTIGAQALGYTALTSVEFPELTTIPTDMFSGTWTLSSAKFPKVTTIEQSGLLVGAKFKPENNPTPFPLELTAEGDITFNGSNHFNIESQNYSGKVDLVLWCDKKDAVTFHDDGTATWQVRGDLSYTFKSITFKD